MLCPKCGKEIRDTAGFCEYCGQVFSKPDASVQTAEKPVKKDNLVPGIVGAVLGAVLGGASIILLSRLGYVAAISGLILAVCTLKGYELLGGQLSKRGIIISIVLMILTPYIADRIDWAILLLEEFSGYGITFAEAFALIPELLAEEAIEASAYYGNLAMIYAFVLLGAFSTLRGVLKKK